MTDEELIALANANNPGMAAPVRTQPSMSDEDLVARARKNNQPKPKTPPPPPASAKPAPPPTWGETLRGGAGSFLPGAAEATKGIGYAVTHAPETLAGLALIGGGMGVQAGNKIASTIFGPQKTSQVKAKTKAGPNFIGNMVNMAREFEKPFVETYGPLFNTKATFPYLNPNTTPLKKAFIKNSFNTLSDIALPFTAAEMGTAKAASIASKAAKAAEVAGNATKAAKLTNRAKTLSKVNKAAGFTRGAVDPFEWAIQGSKIITRPTGGILRGINSGFSGVDPQFFKTISDVAEKPFSPQGRAYVKTATGISKPADTLSNIVDTFKQVVGGAHKAREERLNGLQGSPPQWSPIYGVIDAAHAKLDPMGFRNTPGAVVAHPEAHAALDQVRSLANQHEMAAHGPNAHPDAMTIRNMDTFRDTVGKLARSAKDNNVANALNQVYHEGIVPTLRGAYEGFEDAIDATKLSMADTAQIQKLLNIGGADKAAAIGELTKFLRQTPSGLGNSIYEAMTKLDPTIPARLAAHATSKANLGKVITGSLKDSAFWGVKAPLSIAKNMAGSPGLSATGHYLAGLAGGATAAGTRLAKIPYYGNLAVDAAPKTFGLKNNQDPSKAPKAPVVSIADLTAAVDKIEGRGAEMSGSTKAFGPGQFIPSTFVDTYKGAFPEKAATMTDDQIKALHGTTEGNKIQETLLPYSIKTNVGKLQKAGIEPTPGNVYLAHLLNVNTAMPFINRPDDVLATSVLPKDYDNEGNKRWLRGKTVGQVKKWAENEMQTQIAAINKPSPNAATGGRIQRASGGRIDSGRHEALVNKLMKKAERAKSVSNKVTEPLLEVPDKAIVKALDMAQQAI